METLTLPQREAAQRTLIEGRHGIVPSVNLEIRDIEAGSRFLEARAVPYSVEIDLGWYLEQMAPGVFTKSIQESARSLPLLAFHDARSFDGVIGVNDEWRDLTDGLHGVWRFDDTDAAREAVKRAESGSLAFMSVGFQPVGGEQGSTFMWDDEDRLHILRKEARLLEVSLVATPAYKEAAVTKVRAARPVNATRRVDQARSWLASHR